MMTRAPPVDTATQQHQHTETSGEECREGGKGGRGREGGRDLLEEMEVCGDGKRMFAKDGITDH
jgi:hypothetical protein